MKLTGGLDELAHRRALKRWSRIADAAATLDPFSLGTLRNQASALRGHLDRVIATADRARTGDDPRLPWPSGDWSWRPGIWETAQRPAALTAPESGARLGFDVKLFHDCADPTIILRQETGELAPPVVAMEIFDFDGSFVSLVLDLPDAGIDGLAAHHTVSVVLDVRMEQPVELLGRLNIRSGPNTSQMVTDADRDGTVARLEFDLAYGDLADGKVDAAWFDLIFDNPAMNRVEIVDLIVSRDVRSEI